MPVGQLDDRGESLIEILVAVLIMGTAVVAIVGGLLASVKMSDVHRKQATSGGLARDYAELIDRHVAGSGYVACAGPAVYSPATVGYTLPAVQVASPDGRATEQAVLVVRKPCGQGSTC